MRRVQGTHACKGEVRVRDAVATLRGASKIINTKNNSCIFKKKNLVAPPPPYAQVAAVAPSEDFVANALTGMSPHAILTSAFMGIQFWARGAHGFPLSRVQYFFVSPPQLLELLTCAPRATPASIA